MKNISLRGGPSVAQRLFSYTSFPEREEKKEQNSTFIAKKKNSLRTRATKSRHIRMLPNKIITKIFKTIHFLMLTFKYVN